MQNSALTIGAGPAQPPERVQLPVERPGADRDAGVGLAGRVQPGRLHDPLISSAEYNSSPHARRLRGEGGPVRLGAAELLVRHDARRHRRLHPDQRGRLLGLRQRAERRRHGADPRLARPVHVAERPVEPVAEPEHQPVPPQLRGDQQPNYHFGTLFNFDTALTARYGASSSLGQYVEEAQVQDYENTRAQFEAFIDHANNTPLPSTGTIYWQLNKGWPSMLWTLYNSDGDQAGSYFGVQEANRTLHALYALDNGTVTVDNLGAPRQSGLSVESKVYSLAGAAARRPDRQRHHPGQPAGATKVLTPKVPEAGAARRRSTSSNCCCSQNGTSSTATSTGCPPSRTRRTGQHTLDQPAGHASPVRQPDRAADAAAVVDLGHRHHRSAGRAGRRRPGDHRHASRTPRRPTVAFFLRADVRRGTASGRELPATTNCSPRSGRATTSRCSPASRRR